MVFWNVVGVNIIMIEVLEFGVVWIWVFIGVVVVVGGVFFLVGVVVWWNYMLKSYF